MLLETFPSRAELAGLIELARREDMGPSNDDVTSRLLIGTDSAVAGQAVAGQAGRAAAGLGTAGVGTAGVGTVGLGTAVVGTVGLGTIVQKSPGVAAGLPIVQMVCDAYSPDLEVSQFPGFHMEVVEGHYLPSGQMPLLQIRGPLHSLLSAERVILNFLQHISGVATLTRKFVTLIHGTRAKILDTRKTLPGFRLLDKYAVRAGGGHNHRIGLYDGVLIKDNHLAGLKTSDIAPFLEPIVRQSLAEEPARLFEVEVDTLDQLREVLKVRGVGVILLDNMDCGLMALAVRLRDDGSLASRPLLEASGGVTLQTVRQIAETGVDRISIGALTHSATALDISLDVAEVATPG